jgi:hypothetical protein
LTTDLVVNSFSYMGVVKTKGRKRSDWNKKEKEKKEL